MTCFAENTAKYNIPKNLPTYFKAWMPYTAITDTTSDQWKLQKQAYTDEDGFRRINNDYMVAVGSYYADSCGDRLEVTLDSKKSFTVIVGEFKDDSQTDPKNMYHPVICKGKTVAANILEFIVDTEIMDEEVLNTGTICNLGFEGNIAAIEKILTNEKRSSIEED